MAVNVLRGAAGSGKSQEFNKLKGPDDLLIDVTALWAAVRGLERDPNGRYPVREDDEAGLRMALYLKSTAIAFAAREDLDAWVTTSSSSPEAVERIRELAGGALGVIHTVYVEEDEALKRLRVKGRVSKECKKAVGRWFRRR